MSHLVLKENNQEVPKGYHVHHWDKNIHNNQLVNLEIVTPSQNAAAKGLIKTNTTGFTGVVQKGNGRFHAQINVYGKYKFLGMFKTAEEAARRYDSIAIKHFGKYATLNFPHEWKTDGTTAISPTANEKPAISSASQIQQKS